jgi:threonine/homoserine/homoserine lactone efflux protein
MENILGELWMFKLMSIAGVVYLIYFFIKDRRRKKD